MASIKTRVNEEIDEINKLKLQDKHGSVEDVLLALRFHDDVSHIHYPVDTDYIKRVWDDIAAEYKFDKKVEIVQVRQDEVKQDRKIVFAHHRAAGDGLMLSSGIRDFKLLFPDIKINVDSNQPWIWENNPYIDRSLKKGDEGVEYYKVGYPAVGYANNTYIHFTHMFLLDMIAVADLHSRLPLALGEFCSAFSNGEVGDPCLGKPHKNSESKEPFISLVSKYSGFCKEFSRQRGDIHLSEEEKNNNMIKNIYGVDKYWVIAPGGKRDGTTKIWDWRRFQDVIKHFDGRIKFVTIGRSDHIIEKLDNIIDLTDKTKEVRELVPLVYHAEGCVSGPSFLMHLAAAMPPKKGSSRKPCVVILGGREPTSWVHYANQQVLHTTGAFSCCDNGGCWKSRTHPLPKDPDHNNSLCRFPTEVNGRTIQGCMDTISSADVIRGIEKYYEGDLYKFDKVDRVAPVLTPTVKEIDTKVWVPHKDKEINMVGNLNTAGGGEQSLLKIAEVFREAGWKVNLFPWGSVHKNYSGVDVMPCSFKQDDGVTMADTMTPDAPLLFYGNDCVSDFIEHAQLIVDKCSALIVGINYMLGHFKNSKLSEWLIKSHKLKAVIFQNEEKREEWDRQVIGFEDTKRIVLFGAIDIDKFYEVCTTPRKDKDDLVILKHCVADYRKYITKESYGKGDKVHVWQKNLDKDLDVKFYKRLLKGTANTRFEFMEAHSELEREFKNNPRMVFHKWDSMPVTEFLSRGHIYLYRTSNLWRDQYPRTVAEALAAGLPVLTEPRDGTRDRVVHGDTGFYCVDYDGYLYAIKLLQRKEKYRQQMGIYAKDWARDNLNPRRWIKIIEEILND